MDRLEFVATLDAGDTIHLPDEFAGRFKVGTQIKVSIEPKRVEDMTPDEAWRAILDFARERMAKGATPDVEPYKFDRDSLYDHLEKYQQIYHS